MQCQEKMDRASAKLSRARSALSMATKAGMEATRGELLEMIAIALEQVDAADAEFNGEGDTDALPRATASTGLELVASQPRLVPACAAAANNAL